MYLNIKDVSLVIFVWLIKIELPRGVGDCNLITLKYSTTIIKHTICLSSSLNKGRFSKKRNLLAVVIVLFMVIVQDFFKIE